MLQRSVVESKQDGQASLQLKGIMVRRYQGMLYCLEEKQQYSDLLLGWQSQGKLDWGPYWQIECYDKPISCCDTSAYRVVKNTSH